ncbi:MAG TPA: ABC transporter ATP-binding protein [Gemmatimonadaceae bacterium]
MNAVEAEGLVYAYGRHDALHGVSLAVPEGAIYALLGPNGAGKTTLLQVLANLRRASGGTARLLGRDVRTLDWRDRQAIGYLAEGTTLPGWMRLRELEAYLAPLYPGWDRVLADTLRERFQLDPARKVGTFSRGEQMKAALLCALAPRPKLLLLDEPFTGIDVAVKEDLVRGLLESAAGEGWTVLVASHDIGELEMLADHVGILVQGRMRLDEPLERARERFRRVTVTGDPQMLAAAARAGAGWLRVERFDEHLAFVVSDASPALASSRLPALFPGARTIDVRELPLRELYLAVSAATPEPSAAAPATRTLEEVA